jgi:hypothetical protein
VTVSTVVALKFLAILGVLVWYSRRLSRQNAEARSRSRREE